LGVFEEGSSQMWDYKIKQLNNKKCQYIIEVLWVNYSLSETTHEPEEDINNKHPYVF